MGFAKVMGFAGIVASTTAFAAAAGGDDSDGNGDAAKTKLAAPAVSSSDPAPSAPQAESEPPSMSRRLAELSRRMAKLKTELAATEKTVQALQPKVAALVDTETEALKHRFAMIEQELDRLATAIDDRVTRRDEIVRGRIAAMTPATPDTPKAPSLTRSPGLLAREGWTARNSGDVRAAIEKFEAALKIDPDHDAATNGLAWALLAIDEPERAEPMFRKLIAASDTAYGADNGLAMALLNQQKTDAAIDAFERATQKLIDNMGEAQVVQRGMTASWVNLIQALRTAQRHDEADQWIDRYLQHKPDDKMVQSLRRD